MTASAHPAAAAPGLVDPVLGRAPFRLATALVAWTVVVILFGAMVTSTGSGMAFADWPLSDGQWMPKKSLETKAGFLEHFHRLVAAIAGLLSLTLVVHLWRLRALRTDGGRAAFLGLVLIVVQGLVGGLGVLNNTPVAMSSMHGTLAQITLATFAVTAYRLSARWSATKPIAHPSARGGRRFCVVAVVLLVVQTVLGAIARHSPMGNDHAMWTHVGNALIVFLVVLIAAGLAAGRFGAVAGVAQLSRVLLWLLVVQIVLGFVTLLIRTGKNPANVEHLWRASLISAHVLVGALLTVTTSLLAAHVFRGTLVPGDEAKVARG